MHACSVHVSTFLSLAMLGNGHNSWYGTHPSSPPYKLRYCSCEHTIDLVFCLYILTRKSEKVVEFSKNTESRKVPGRKSRVSRKNSRKGNIGNYPMWEFFLNLTYIYIYN